MIFMLFREKNYYFDGKVGVVATVVSKGLGPQDPTKKLAYRVDPLDQKISRKSIFKNFGHEPHLHPPKWHLI